MILPVKPGSVIQAGQIVSATSPDLFIRTAGTLFHLELYEDAIRQNEKAIELLADKKQLAVAWNNKGVCLMSLKNENEAKECFEQALLNDPSLSEARANLEKLSPSGGPSR